MEVQSTLMLRKTTVNVQPFYGSFVETLHFPLNSDGGHFSVEMKHSLPSSRLLNNVCPLSSVQFYTHTHAHTHTHSSDKMGPQKSRLHRQPLSLLHPLWWIHTIWFSNLQQTGLVQTSQHWAHTQASTHRCEYTNNDAASGLFLSQTFKNFCLLSLPFVL